ncbi:MAG: Uma2 family endonuclease [Actinomycetota bacterium]|nr:Uma2 family endonuclease [Actinomycetota bacterium]
MALPWGEPLTVDDLDAIPDDGHRYELIDGAMLVTPAPATAHQRCVARLVALLLAAAGSDYDVLPAPFDWVVSNFTKFQPDVVVARRSDVGEHRLERTPLLVVEVLSPSTRVADLTLKRAAYAEAGVPTYWIVDVAVPSVTVLHLEEAAFVETAVVAGDEEYESDAPFPVRVRPSDLVS